MLDLQNLSVKQKELLEKIWGLCVYFQAARRYAPESVLAEQSRNIGLMVDDFDKEESRKNKLNEVHKTG